MPAEHSVAPGIGCVHVPSAAPAPIAQMPPQHSVSCAHESPFCVQNDDAPQNPLVLHADEQQSVPAVQGFPSVLHVGLSAMHEPFEHAPLQHWLSVVHADASAVHCVLEHTLLTQLSEQQSVFAEHDEPATEHVVGFAAHAPCGSQTAEQQSPPPTHEAPNTPHG